MYIARPTVIAKILKTTQMSKYRWMDAVLRKSKIMKFGAKWMELKDIMLGKVRKKGMNIVWSH